MPVRPLSSTEGTIMKAATLAYWLHGFFHEWLAQQRNLSHHTVMSYRDTWRLFLRFIAERRRRSVSDLAFEELTASEVLAFLRYSEEERKVTIGTRNCRLAALRSFFRFVGDREPLVLSQCAEVLRIPTKRRQHRRFITSMSMRSLRSCGSLIGPPWRGSAIMRCLRCYTTRAPESRKLWTCAPEQFGSDHPLRSRSLVKDASSASARSGPKLRTF